MVDPKEPMSAGRMMGGCKGSRLCFWRVGRVARSRYGSGRAVPISCQVVLGAIGAAHVEGNTTVANWFEVPTHRAGQIGALVFCFRLRASAKGTSGRVLALGLNMAKPPTIVALLRGRGRVGSLDNIVAVEDRNFGEVGQEFPFFGRHLYHDREGLLVVEA